jgi:hypothetical protein
VGGGAVLSGGILIAGLPRLALSAPSPEQDARILNLVLLLEETERTFYAEALRRGALQGELREFARVVGAHEEAHVAFLRKALGRAARKPPRLEFGDTTGDPDRFAVTAATLEDTVVAAYNGQATNLTKPTLRAAATIVSVEARHAAWIRDIIGRTAAPKAVEPPLTAGQAQAKLRRFVRR